jgi:RNA recognition motif-containing protein
MSRLDMSLEQIISRGSGKGDSKGKQARSAMAARAARRATPYSRQTLGRSVGRPAARVSGGGTSVYVGNLSWDVSWQDLKDHFKSVGHVTHADVMLEPGSTRSKGCGLVTFANAKDAQTAIATLHDTELNGRLIFVREDRESSPGTANLHGRGSGGVASGAGGEGCKVFVGNLPFDTTWANLKDLFREAGTVLHADVATGPDGSSKGYGTVLLGTTRDAAKAIQLFNESEFGGRTLEVRPDARP